MTWTREHDALIARVAEGLTVRPWSEMPESVQNYDYDPSHFFVGDGVHDKMAAYNTDLVAVACAMESWREKHPHRWWAVKSPSVEVTLRFGVTCSVEYRGLIDEWATTEAEARAWALWNACGGEPKV